MPSHSHTPTPPHPHTLLPYGRQSIGDDDIAAVVEVLKSDWLTTGPRVAEFERAFASSCGAKHAVAVCNGTAALHCAMAALGIGQGDEVLVPAMTFAATANSVVFRGGTPVFADVRDEDLLIDAEKVEKLLEQEVAKAAKRVKAIVTVDYAGMPCDYDRLRAIAVKYGLPLIADACHAVGGSYKGRPVGSLADMSTFSFHPVKNMTTGEGGMVTTDSDEFAARIRRFRSHGVTVDFRQRMESNSWFYEMVDLGWNYRITDFQCALGISQLRKLPGWIKRRNEIAARYDEAFSKYGGMGAGECGGVLIRLVPHNAHTPTPPYSCEHGRHLYVIRVPASRRAEIFGALRTKGIGVNVHYIPVHLHPFYRERFGTGPGDCPVAEKAYEEIISLPMYPGMTDEDVNRVIESVKRAVMEGT